MKEEDVEKPLRIPEKLPQIRTAIGVSQSKLSEVLESTVKIRPGSISAYECGRQPPPSSVLEAYARCAGVSTKVLTDDDLELP